MYYYLKSFFNTFFKWFIFILIDCKYFNLFLYKFNIINKLKILWIWIKIENIINYTFLLIYKYFNLTTL